MTKFNISKLLVKLISQQKFKKKKLYIYIKK